MEVKSNHTCTNSSKLNCTHIDRQIVLNQIAYTRRLTYGFLEFHELLTFMCQYSSTDCWWASQNQAFESPWNRSFSPHKTYLERWPSSVGDTGSQIPLWSQRAPRSPFWITINRILRWWALVSACPSGHKSCWVVVVTIPLQMSQMWPASARCSSHCTCDQGNRTLGAYPETSEWPGGLHHHNYLLKLWCACHIFE